MKNTISALLIFLLCNSIVNAQTPLDPSDLSIPTKIAPEYFGPNAFPVPAMMDGTTNSKWKIELYSNHFFGTIAGWEQDYTTDIFASLTIPLFTPRINLVIWGPLHEYAYTGSQVNEFRRINPPMTVKHTGREIFIFPLIFIY